ncbi:CRISPR-associated RAMP protein [Candidatus Bathyarchaeota archaeon]|nr:CRISPR-associated RAMP protein [Candidatus Bathyarchaeota archaeon]MBS7613544.1 CRISPR-associated RAMP protein [Candidatus Bathyarchaeota archaeon]
MPDYRDFDRLNILARIEGILINETPLRVGVGREPPLGSPIDLAIYKVNDEPCIPGSSLKGLFRSYLESILASEGYKVHPPYDDESVEAEAKNGDFCVICGIFGNNELASHVRLYDSRAKSRRTFQKTGISIDRDFGSVRAGALFTEELVPPNVEWSFRMDIINIKIYPELDPEDERAKRLRSLIETLSTIGLNVGSRKSVGYGLIKLKKAKWTAYKVENGLLKKVGEGDVL